MLPKAKIVYCVRNPIDNCYSIFKNYFVGNQDFAYSLDELGVFYRYHQELMQHWFSLFPDWIHTVRCEDMVKNTKSEVQKLLQFCELPYEESVLEFYKSKRSVVTASSYQVRRPIYTKSVGLWKQYEEELQPLLKALR